MAAAVPDPEFAAIDALTAAYGSAYCIVLLTRGPKSGSGNMGGPALGALPGKVAPNPLGAGSENAPYASMLGLPAGIDVVTEVGV